MCGISGCVNAKHAGEVAAKIAANQIARGKDSAGIAYVVDTGDRGPLVTTFKRLGTPTKFLKDNEPKLENLDISSAIGHNRWPSHGSITLHNAHPFRSCDGTFALVHNGSAPIPNGIWTFLEKRGHTIQGRPDPTDSEMFLHTIEELLKANHGDRMLALRAFNKIASQFSILLIFNDGEIWGTRTDRWPCVVVQRPGGGTYFASEEGGFKDVIPKDEKVKILIPGQHTIYRTETNGGLTFWGDYEKEERELKLANTTIRYIDLSGIQQYFGLTTAVNGLGGTVGGQLCLGSLADSRRKRNIKKENEVPDLAVLRRAAGVILDKFPDKKFDLESKKQRKHLRKMIRSNLWIREKLDEEEEELTDEQKIAQDIWQKENEGQEA